MNIKKYAESTVDESVFYGKVEVETESKSEWENVILVLETAFANDSVVCHCNLKENAELIATILDHDTENKVCPIDALRGEEDGK